MMQPDISWLSRVLSERLIERGCLPHGAAALKERRCPQAERARQLDIEYGQLQLEMSTWANHPRIEKIARERLLMVAPDALGRVVPPTVTKKGGR